MSKAVKSIGRAIGKVVKGVVKVVKKVASSKIGKIILAAATIYFGGAALMGAMGGASAGTGFLGTISGAVQGAGAGISSAWSGLTGAFTGGGLSSLGQGFTGSYGAGSSAVTASNMAATGGGFAGGGYGSVGLQGQTGAQVAGMTSSTTAGAANTMGSAAGYAPAAATTPVTSPGLVSGAWNGLGEYGKMAAVSGGMQLAGGALQGKAAQDQMEDQRQYELEQQTAARNRYNENVGTRLWGDAPSAGSEYSGPSVFAQQDMRMQQNPYANSPYVRPPKYMPQNGGLVAGMMPGYGYYPT